MKLVDIWGMPDTLKPEDYGYVWPRLNGYTMEQLEAHAEKYGHFPASGYHESLLRSYQIVQAVKDLLARGTPGDVVLELIQQMERPPEELKSHEAMQMRCRPTNAI